MQTIVGATTDMLVASRKDTVKALRAAERGVAVVTYPEFINRALVGVDLETGFKPDNFSKYVDPELLVPDFTPELGPEDLL